MVSWKDEITDPANTTFAKFGGITVNHILQYFKAIDLAAGGTDATGNADIATETLFANECLKLWDSNKSHKIKLQTPDYNENKTWTFPNESAMGASDEVMFKDSVAIVSGKSMSGGTNTFTDIPKSALPSPTMFEDEDNALGAHFLAISQIAAPANPAAGTVRIFLNTSNGITSVKKSDGSTVQLESGAGGGDVFLNQSNTYGDVDSIFRSSRVKIRNPANTFSYSLVGAAIAAARNITLPLLAGNDTMVTEAFAQTLSNKTLSGDTTLADGANIVAGTTTGTKIATATNQKVGFFDATPVVRQSAIADVDTGTVDTSWGTSERDVVLDLRTKLNSVLTVLRNLGLIAP
jgi:hypothetical protein